MGDAPSEENRSGSNQGASSKEESGSGEMAGAPRGSCSASGGRNNHSLGFLALDFGPRTKWAWLFPWMKKMDCHYRFKETLLGGWPTVANRTWNAKLGPWFNAQVKAEEAFIVEMRVLSTLRHPVCAIPFVILTKYLAPNSVSLLCFRVSQLSWVQSSTNPMA